MSAIAPRLELRQGQSLQMTQQLQQSIKLLQMSAMEINEFVEQELEKNPLLEMAEEEGEKSGEAEVNEPVEEQISHESEEVTPVTEPDVSEPEPFEFESTELRTKTVNTDGDFDDFESYTPNDISLREFLLEQLQLEVQDPVKRMIGQHLIDRVDEAGYIREETESIEKLLDCTPELIEETFAILHNFEPVGVCARNLQECLSIQLREKNCLDPAMEVVLEHLALVAGHDLKQLAKLCALSLEDVKQMCEEVKALNPRPASEFQHEKVQEVTPDVFLRRANGIWNVELNSANLPRVLVNRRYYTQVYNKAQKQEEKKYLSEQMLQANWLVKALDSRAQTILKVATELLKKQENFFLFGIKELRPLTLKETAEAVGLHESTVSRVTTNKFIQTPRGTYEFKYFFSSTISNNFGGDNYSSKTVQFMIKELIENEKHDNVLSDDMIAEKLKDNGIDVARRTVAKYRELLKIPTSSLRKRQKKRS